MLDCHRAVNTGPDLKARALSPAQSENSSHPARGAHFPDRFRGKTRAETARMVTEWVAKRGKRRMRRR